MTIEYDVVHNWNDTAFIKSCNLRIQQGWQLHGGVSVAVDTSNSRVFAQAFVRDSGDGHKLYGTGFS
jgi:hypothetical protein